MTLHIMFIMMNLTDATVRHQVTKILKEISSHQRPHGHKTIWGKKVQAKLLPRVLMHMIYNNTISCIVVGPSQQGKVVKYYFSFVIKIILLVMLV